MNNPVEVMLRMLPIHPIGWELINSIASTVIAAGCFWMRVYSAGEDRVYFRGSRWGDQASIKAIRFALASAAVVAMSNWCACIESVLTGKSPRQMLGEILLNITMAGVMTSAVFVHIRIRERHGKSKSEPVQPG